MNRKYLAILNLLLFQSLFGCSFSKKPGAEILPAAEANRSIKPEYSAVQSKLMISIGSRDLEKAKGVISEFSHTDFDFSAFDETPAGLTIKNNLPEFMTLLISERVDTTNLGKEKNQTEVNTFKDLLNEEQLKRKFTSAKAVEISSNLAERVWDSHNHKFINDMLDYIQSDEFDGAAAVQRSSNLNCQYVHTRLILQMQARDIFDFSKLERYLKTIPCEIDPSYITDLYTFELVRQFQKMFLEPASLTFFFHHPRLTTSLWNMNGSGVWISPGLLIRIAYSRANIKNINKNFDPCLVNPSPLHPLCGTGTRENSEFLNSLGAPAENYELIDSRPGRIKYSYIFYQTEELFAYGVEKFFLAVSAYVAGDGPADFKILDGEVDSSDRTEFTDEKGT